MKIRILFFSLLLTVSCAACNRGPKPVPQGSTSKLTLTVSPLGNRGNNPGSGSVKLTPTPQSGNADCAVAGNQPITCVVEFAPGATVSLRVVPDSSIIESLNGCNVTGCEGCPPGVTTCQVVMNRDQAVSVVFFRMR